MKTTALAAALAATLLASTGTIAKTIELDGSNLTIAAAMEIARGEADVAVTPEAKKRLEDTFTLVMAAARKGMAVYGLTTGVGLNKDKKLFDANGELSEEVLKASQNFNQTMPEAK